MFENPCVILNKEYPHGELLDSLARHFGGPRPWKEGSSPETQTRIRWHRRYPCTLWERSPPACTIEDLSHHGSFPNDDTSAAPDERRQIVDGLIPSISQALRGLFGEAMQLCLQVCRERVGAGVSTRSVSSASSRTAGSTRHVRLNRRAAAPERRPSSSAATATCHLSLYWLSPPRAPGSRVHFTHGKSSPARTQGTVESESTDEWASIGSRYLRVPCGSW